MDPALMKDASSLGEVNNSSEEESHVTKFVDDTKVYDDCVIEHNNIPKEEDIKNKIHVEPVVKTKVFSEEEFNYIAEKKIEKEKELVDNKKIDEPIPEAKVPNKVVTEEIVEVPIFVKIFKVLSMIASVIVGFGGVLMGLQFIGVMGSQGDSYLSSALNTFGLVAGIFIFFATFIIISIIWWYYRTIKKVLISINRASNKIIANVFAVLVLVLFIVVAIKFYLIVNN